MLHSYILLLQQIEVNIRIDVHMWLITYLMQVSEVNAKVGKL